MNVNLELILVIGTLITGLVVLLDKLVFAEKRRKRILNETYDAKFVEGVSSNVKREYKEPWYIDYSRSFFPVLLIVLILRSFIAEPFRIPSGSMMPTLLHGDFILVNKFTYGLRLPVLHNKVLANNLPQRGEVIVFRYPKNPSLDYIKRVIGLPGDRLEYRDKTVYVNGEAMKQVDLGIYIGKGRDSVMSGSEKKQENLNTIKHDVLINERRLSIDSAWTIPDGHYFVMGDNRDNSNDSRVWGMVPEQNLVGKAFMIWMNWDISEGQFDFRRIGKKIK
ncbi:MAG: signal peptidase I [Gammaproteobacteria bacterium]|nr:signal peptidase I [Gammaproteobacteria bacterium]